MWFITINNLKKDDPIDEVWTRHFAEVPYDVDAGTLERTLERHSEVVVTKRNKKGKITKVF